MRRSFILPLTLPLALIAACADGRGEPDDMPPRPRLTPPPSDTPSTPDPTVKAKMKNCSGQKFTTPNTPEPWASVSNRVTATAGFADHSAQDFLAIDGAENVLKARFVYTPFFAEIEQEKIRVYMDDYTGFKLVAEGKTDDSGWLTVKLPARAIGVYDIRFEVAADLTTASAQLWVLPKGTRLTVFDIDGTLTTSDGELLYDIAAEIFSGEYVPALHPKAAELTWAHRGQNGLGVYLSARPWWLAKLTREWLASSNMAPGIAHFAPSNNDALPTNGYAGEYKKKYLQELVAMGFVIDFAYGNAGTDIYAYAGAGIPAAKTLIIGKHAGEMGTIAVTGGWDKRINEVDELPNADQPFVW